VKIAIMGIRGIPARYGGFETFAEGLATRLVERGHEVTVYGRSNAIDRNLRVYRGVKITVLPTISHKYLDTVVHTLLCVIHSLRNRYDVILICNAANSLFSWVPRMAGQKVALNVDGIERLRKKWGSLGKAYYRLGEYLATRLPDAIVSDAEVIRDYYCRAYNKDSVMIPYGTEAPETGSTGVLDQFGLRPDGYVLYVSRLEPENNAHLVIEAFKMTATERKLVIVGDAPYAGPYKRSLRTLAKDDGRIIFTGFVFGTGYRELQSHAYCYIQATEVGGTHPALIEAMAFGNCILANGTPENIEVLGDSGLFYRKNETKDLGDKLQYLIEHPEVRAEFQQRARRRARELYSWERVVEQYEQLFLRLTGPEYNGSRRNRFSRGHEQP
jgi:glycosyltransferase involved in cell wall biosynthesis